MNAPIIWLDQVGLGDRPTVGGKAAALGALLQAGLSVPAGFCIPVTAAGAVSDEFWAEVASAYRRLSPDLGAVAVRSSAVDEDGREAAFAGQYETILNVRGMGELRGAVHRCWVSANSQRVTAYRTAWGRLSSELAVLVQLQVDAAVSGVLFTRDPVSGDPGRLLVEVVPGMGETLVSGRTSPSAYVLDRQGQVVSSAGKLLLSAEQCRELAGLARRVESVLGRGQDIEWALADGRFYLLQSRPITTGGQELPVDEYWTRANVGEVFPNPVTPLTWSVFYTTILGGRQAGSPNGQDESKGSLSPDRPHPGLRRIQGRIYLRLDALLDSFCYLPGVTPTVMAQVLGAPLPASVQDYRRPGGLPVFLAQAVFFLDALGHFPRLDWMAHRLPEPPQPGSDQIERLLAWTAGCFQLHLKATAYAIGAFAQVSALLSGRLSEAVSELLPRLLLGRDDLHTAAQGRTLWRLAGQIRSSPPLQKILSAGLDWPEMAADLAKASGGDEFLEAFQRFLDEYGARAAGEFELAQPRWREEPVLVIQILRKYLEQPADEHGSGWEQTEKVQQARELVRRQLSPLEAVRFERLLASYRRYTTLRENLKYRLMEGYGLLRQSYLEKADRLVETGKLTHRGDIFFLSIGEILALEEDEWPGQDFVGQISRRKGQYAVWWDSLAPDLVLGDHFSVPAAGAGQLAGIGCSSGVVTAPARVLRDVSQAGLLQPGEILVAPHTDPGWTPLFLTCAGVVTEVGGFLSHGATVAREYGIPCVANVAGATNRIKTGDLIQVDGLLGRVAICRTGDRQGEPICLPPARSC